MKKAYWFNYEPASWPRLHKAVTITLLVALLAGLIPPPLIRTMLLASVAPLVEATLPTAAPAATAPLAPVSGSNVLTITKTVVNSVSARPYNITVRVPPVAS